MGKEGFESEPLSEEAAEEEAGMLQAHLELSDVQEATTEDYDAALEAIEELKELANSEEAMKAGQILARLAVHSKFAFNYVSGALSSSFPFLLMNHAVKEHEKAMYELDSAAEKLRKLKEKAESK